MECYVGEEGVGKVFGLVLEWDGEVWLGEDSIFVVLGLLVGFLMRVLVLKIKIVEKRIIR